MSTSPLFHYVCVDNKAEKTLFLFHGTGGTENDFLFLNDAIKDSYNLVGLRGNIDEHGSRRFFKRLAPGVFDENSIREEAPKVVEFIQNWQYERGITAESCSALGFSNGANILFALFLLYPDTILFHDAILMHPMMPFKKKVGKVHNPEKILVTHGDKDQMVSSEEQALVNATLVNAVIKRFPEGHTIHKQEVSEVITWLMR
jgi:phospholipase/carboxylesterase